LDLGLTSGCSIPVGDEKGIRALREKCVVGLALQIEQAGLVFCDDEIARRGHFKSE
jgi:hypothetical protein